MLGHPGPPGQGHAPDGSARHALQGRRPGPRSTRSRPQTGRDRSSIPYSCPAQPRCGMASACQHVTSDREIPIVVELPRFGAVVITTATLCALASDYASTGHVWITVRRRHGLNPFRIFSLPIESIASGLVTGAWPPGSPGMSPGIAPPSAHIAQFIHKPYTQPPYLASRACSNGDDGWPEAQLIAWRPP